MDWICNIQIGLMDASDSLPSNFQTGSMCDGPPKQRAGPNLKPCYLNSSVVQGFKLFKDESSMNLKTKNVFYHYKK